MCVFVNVYRREFVAPSSGSYWVEWSATVSPQQVLQLDVRDVSLVYKHTGHNAGSGETLLGWLINSKRFLKVYSI